ncbi:MAG: phosphoribosylanthranilate isomerase [Pseudomonadota bacterium]
MRVKVCGLTTAEQVRQAGQAGAAYIGFNFFPKSPRSVGLDKAGALALEAPAGVAKVALLVDPDDALVDAVAALPMDMIQLHGSETPERVSAVRTRTGLPVMKAIGIRDADDLDAIDRYAPVSDQLLIDAKPPRTAELPGGNGLTFDWRLIAGRRWPVPWLLAGGLTADNVAEAIRLTGAAQVDVASGVESAPGVKDPAKVTAFINASKS